MAWQWGAKSGHWSVCGSVCSAQGYVTLTRSPLDAQGRTVALSLRKTWPVADRDCVRVAGHEPLAFDGQSLSQIAASLSA